jgi:hypothetical protein
MVCTDAVTAFASAASLPVERRTPDAIRHRIFAMRRFICLIVIALLGILAGALTTGAAETTVTNAPAVPRISREQLREQIKNLTPEERAARLKQWREQNAALSTNELDRRRELLKALTPAEREAKLREWRQRGVAGTNSLRTAPAKLSQEQREAKRKEIQQRVQGEFEKLRQKEADGTISDEEKIRLRRVEAIRKRLTESPAATPAVPEAGK